MAARREQGFYSTLVSVSSVDILPNSETKSQIKKKKKKRSCRSLTIANAASERKKALIQIIRKSSRLLLVRNCLSSQKKKIVFGANSAIHSNLLWTESRGVCSEIFKMVECFCLSRWRCKKGCSLSFSLLIP